VTLFKCRKLKTENLKFQGFNVSAFQRFAPWHGVGSTETMLLLGFRGFRRTNKRAFVSISHLGLMAGIALFTATVVGGSGYLIQELHRQAGVAKVAVGLAPIDRTVMVPVSPDMLKVSSIALGRTPIAIVNGAVVEEGGTVRVQTTNGVATAEVLRIRDGLVQFKYGEQTILVNLP
jgi:hypothetical protein